MKFGSAPPHERNWRKELFRRWAARFMQVNIQEQLCPGGRTVRPFGWVLTT